MLSFVAQHRREAQSAKWHSLFTASGFLLSVVHPQALFLRGLAGVCNQSWDAAGISDPHERWD